MHKYIYIFIYVGVWVCVRTPTHRKQLIVNSAKVGPEPPQLLSTLSVNAVIWAASFCDLGSLGFLCSPGALAVAGLRAAAGPGLGRFDVRLECTLSLNAWRAAWRPRHICCLGLGAINRRGNDTRLSIQEKTLEFTIIIHTV